MSANPLLPKGISEKQWSGRTHVGLAVVTILGVHAFSFAVLLLVAFSKGPSGTNPNTLDTMLSQLPWGTVASHIPNAIRLDSDSEAVLRLSPSKTIEELQGLLGTNQSFQSFRIQIAPRMKASLIPDTSALAVIPKTEPIQAVSFASDTEWTWRISARKPGKHWIQLQVAILLKIDGEETYRTIRSTESYVMVRSPLARLLLRLWSEHWKWSVTTIVLPAVFFGWRALQQRRRNKLEEEQERKRRMIGFHIEQVTKESRD